MFGRRFFNTVALGGIVTSLIGSTGSTGNTFASDDDFDFYEYFAPCRISKEREMEIKKMRGAKLLKEIVEIYGFSEDETERFLSNLRKKFQGDESLGNAYVYYRLNDSGRLEVELHEAIVGRICFFLDLSADMVDSILVDADSIFCSLVKFFKKFF